MGKLAKIKMMTKQNGYLFSIIYAAVKDYITVLLIIYDFLVGVYMYMYVCVYNTAASIIQLHKMNK